MRMMGHNLLAIVVAAIAIYAIEFLIFAVLIPGEQYMALTGFDADQAEAGMSRMPVGALMPILFAIGLSLTIKWRAALGVTGGAVTGFLMALLLAFPASLYSYVYGAHAEAFLPINLAHYLVCFGVAGAILGAWK